MEKSTKTSEVRLETIEDAADWLSDRGLNSFVRSPGTWLYVFRGTMIGIRATLPMA